MTAMTTDDLWAKAHAENTEADVVLARIRPKTGSVCPAEVARIRAECASQVREENKPVKGFTRRLLSVAYAALVAGGSEAAK